MSMLRLWASAMVVVGLAGGAAAQTLATGDARTVTEPAFPAVCSTLAAQQATVSGGPASETTLDTTRLQTALTACASGQALELTASGANNAFLTGPLNIPNGVGLIVDGGVTVFASRNAPDYQTTSTEVCGTYGSSGNGCKNLITFNNGNTSSGCGIYGYGVIDGRGQATILKSGVDTGVSWWTNADQATSAGKSQDNPIMIKQSKLNSFTLYKITLRNSPMFHVGWQGTGFTAWGVKIQAPYTAHNTDGIDPVGSNVTITNSSISDGDDEIAVGASSASSNVTISNVTTYSGHGISIGSYTQSGLTNMLVKNVNMAGYASDGNENGLRIKSALDRGGVLNTISYVNVCMRDMKRPLYITPVYNTNTGTEIPYYQNVTLQNVHLLPPTLAGLTYLISDVGADANHLTTLNLTNVVFEGTLSYSPVFADTTIALSGNVYPPSLQAQAGTNVNYTGSATSTLTPAYDCSATGTIFPYIVGELYVSTPTANNLQTISGTAATAYTLNAMVQPALSQTTFNGTVGSYTGAAALTAGVNFFEGTTKVGTATIGANGTLASVTLTGLTVGTHTYTAQYVGDANYQALTFGSVKVIVSAGQATTTTLTAPTAQTYGATTSLSATVTAATGTPTGTVTFFDGQKQIASGTLVAGTYGTSVTLLGGTHTLTAVYGGDGNNSGSTSAPVTLQTALATPGASVTASPTTLPAGNSATLTATVTGVQGGVVATGTVSFTDGTNDLGSANLNASGVATESVPLPTAGARTITATYNGDTNYNTATASTGVTVTANSSTITLATPAAVTYGSTVTLMATLTSVPAGTMTGTIAFADNLLTLATIPVSGNAASYTVPVSKLAAGAHSFTAVYSGDMTYPTATSAAVPYTVAMANSVTTVTASPATVTAGGSSTLTATVAGVAGASTPTGMVTFADGATTLGTANLSGGVATLQATLTNLGSRTITATYSSDGNYNASGVTVTVTVNAVVTTTTLTVSPVTAYPNENVTLTAAVTPANATGTVTFMSGATTLGTATVTSGVATFVYKPTALGAITMTAALGANGIYGASTSGVVTVTVLAAATVASTPNTLNIAAGSSGMVTLTFASNSGYTGPVALACSSPVNYVTCAVAAPTVSIVNANSVSTTGTITVAATTSMLERVPTVFYGVLGLAFAGVLRRRKKLAGLALMMALAGVFAGLAGCGGGATTAATGTNNKPSGTQVVTFTATASGNTQTTSVTVNIQ